MGVKKSSSKAPLFLLFALLSFGTGYLMITVAGNNTENRSKASGADPYLELPPGAHCTIDNSGNPNSCNYCKHGIVGAAAMEGQQRTCATISDLWDQCMTWDQQNNCVDTYKTYKEKREKDWRCKKAFSKYGLCPYSQVEYPPTE